jgi:hypothetical protein
MTKIIEVSGYPEEIGYQVGTLFKSQLQREAEECVNNMPKGISYELITEYLVKSDRMIREFDKSIYDEMVAVSKGCDVPFNLFLLMSAEELWDYDDLPAIPERCTDLLARDKATVDRNTWLAHTNDGSIGAAPVLIKVKPNGGVPFLGFSNDGYFFSFACNEKGLVFSGNALTADDIKPGIPRLVLFRAGLSKSTPKQSMKCFLAPNRSSSYNNIMLDKLGNAYLYEASATSYVPLRMTDDIHAHTNHYVHLIDHDMNDSYESSIYRREAGLRLLNDFYGQIDENILKSIMKDHGFTGYDGICRHEAPDVVTQFSVVICPEKRYLEYSIGSPCKAEWNQIQYY